MNEWLKRRKRNVKIFQESEKVLKDGYYVNTNNEIVNFKLSKEEMEECEVYLPGNDFKLVYECDKCEFACLNEDSFSVANKLGDNVLVLNLADPIYPGGLVRQGSNAQEETLCRKSSLLLSLESDKAQSYYVYNSYKGRYSSDAAIITKKVEVFRKENYQFLDDSKIVSVITIPAPIVHDKEECLNESYQKVMRKRIKTMLLLAGHLGYKKLVLGAFGCGAFNNDAKIVAKLFSEVIAELIYKDGKYLFSSISFAVLCCSDTYNFDNFNVYFGKKSEE